MSSEDDDSDCNTSDWMDARDPERIALRHWFLPFKESHGIKDEYNNRILQGIREL